MLALNWINYALNNLFDFVGMFPSPKGFVTCFLGSLRPWMTSKLIHDEFTAFSEQALYPM